jgi:O-antigen/teichoic acid export membrane protein
VAAPTTRTVTSGFGWVALFSYSNRVFSLIAILILAKVLRPEDFGIVAIASMLIEVLQIFKDMGLSEAVIYSKRNDTKAIDTAHTILVTYSAALFLIAVVAAPLAARYYDNSQIAPVVIVMASSLVWDSLRNIPRTLFRKNLDYRKLLLPEVVPVAISSAVSIGMALTGWGVWSLVVKSVLHSVLGFIMLQSVMTYRPAFAFDKAAARELFHYGKFIAGTTVILVTLYNIDRFYVSSLSGVAALGLYELAIRIADLPVKQVSFLVGNVMFPVFSRIGHAKPELRRAFIKTLKYTSSVTAPAAACISVYGPPLVWLLYGPRWQGMHMPLRLLAVYAAFRSLSSIIHDLFKATGRPQYMTMATTFKLASIGLLGMPVLTAFGVVGLCLLIVGTYVLAFGWEVGRLARILEMNSGSLVGVVAKPFLLAALVIPGTYVGAGLFLDDERLWQILLSLGLAAALYAVALSAVDREVIGDLRKVRNSYRSPRPELGASAAR